MNLWLHSLQTVTTIKSSDGVGRHSACHDGVLARLSTDTWGQQTPGANASEMQRPVLAKSRMRRIREVIILVGVDGA